ncbi:hypothetical protein [Amycolatopsis solani]|uniref:hypothetical protein n=1 Tax=Amycolatopsis solani TaxID=3028615 RepID=UPI0025B13C66|nr:hypothetical protein [Amycolatopsis sp. MEP2-6]
MEIFVIVLGAVALSALGLSGYALHRLRRTQKWVAAHIQAQAILRDPPPDGGDGKRRHLRIVAVFAPLAAALSLVFRKAREHPAAAAAASLAASGAAVAATAALVGGLGGVGDGPPGAMRDPAPAQTATVTNSAPAATSTVAPSSARAGGSGSGSTAASTPPAPTSTTATATTATVPTPTASTAVPVTSPSTTVTTTVAGRVCVLDVELTDLLQLCL